MSLNISSLKPGVLAIFLLFAAPATLLGQELKLTPSLVAKEEFNDNIFLATGNHNTDFITTLTPSLEISSRTERREAVLSGGINWLDYNRHSSSNAVDYFVSGSGSYLLNPRLALSAGASYNRNSRPDQIDSATGLTINSESSVQGYQTGGSYAASEKSKVSLSYGFTKQDYTRSGYLGSMQHQASAGYSYTLTPQTSLESNFSYNRQLTDVSQVDNYTGTVGFSYRLRELWNLSLMAGGRYTDSKLESGGTTNSNGDGGWVGSLAFSYNGEKLSSTLSFNHDVSLAAGRTGSTERTGGAFNLSRKFTEEFSGSALVGYYHNKSNQDQYSVLPIDENTLELSCTMHYDLNRYFALEASYHYVNIDYKEYRTRADQNIFMIRLKMQRMVYF